MEYETLVKNLRDASKVSEALSALLPKSDGNAMARLLKNAADAIEELQQIASHYEETSMDYFKDVCYYMDRVPKWIPVTERLPEVKCHILVTDGKFVGEAAFFPETKWHKNYSPAMFCDPVEEYENYRGTHWMPLPKPPKEDEA